MDLQENINLIYSKCNSEFGNYFLERYTSVSYCVHIENSKTLDNVKMELLQKQKTSSTTTTSYNRLKRIQRQDERFRKP